MIGSKSTLFPCNIIEYPIISAHYFLNIRNRQEITALDNVDFSTNPLTSHP